MQCIEGCLLYIPKYEIEAASGRLCRYQSMKSTNWGCMHRWWRKNCDPVYDKYKDGRCRSMCGTDFKT